MAGSTRPEDIDFSIDTTGKTKKGFELARTPAELTDIQVAAARVGNVAVSQIDNWSGAEMWWGAQRVAWSGGVLHMTADQVRLSKERARDEALLALSTGGAVMYLVASGGSQSEPASLEPFRQRLREVRAEREALSKGRATRRGFFARLLRRSRDK